MDQPWDLVTGSVHRITVLPLTRVLPATAENIEFAAKVLIDLGVVAFPTDTVYGIGVYPFSEVAVNKLFAAKIRPREKPFQLLLEKADDVSLVAERIPPEFNLLASRFFPGGLSVVLPKSSSVPLEITAGMNTVAIRVPDHPVAVELIRKSGGPIAATSANISGQPSPLTADDVRRQLGGRIDIILDGGPCPGGIESTVLDLTVDPPRVLREGAVSRQAIEQILQRKIL